MRSAWGATACVGAVTVALLAAAPPPEAGYVDGPPAAHAGGFGGDTCHAGHFENAPDAPGGAFTLRGVPEAFDPSATYRITVSLERPWMRRAGFQLTVRVGAGNGVGGPAGNLHALAGDDRVQASPAADGVTYAQHTEAGTALTRPGTAFWTVERRPPATTAPAGDDAALAFHAAANAANDDASEFGDFIYTASATTRRAGP